MEAVKIFASTSGLFPFSLNRVSATLATTIATLVIAKLIDGYLFCGFNTIFYVDLPVGIALFVGCCILPLSGLAVKRETTTKCGSCCRNFVVVAACLWFFCVYFAAAMVGLYSLFRLRPSDALDPFNVCDGRSIEAVKAEYRNAMPTFELVQRVDAVFKLFIAIGWFLVAGFSVAGFVAWLCWSSEILDQHTNAALAADKPEGKRNDAIIWIEAESDGSAGAKNETINEINRQPAAIDIDGESTLDDAALEVEDRKSEVGSVDVRMENLRNEINEPGSNAEPQSKEAKEPEFSIVNEEDGAAKATKEDEVNI